MTRRSSSSKLGAIAAALTLLAMLVLLAAGLAKAWDVGAFAADLEGWTLIPPFARPVLALAVPLAEIGIATAWMLGLGRRVAVIAGVGLLTSSGAVAAAHIAVGVRPDCGCFGRLIAFEESRRVSERLLAGDAVMIGMLASGILCSRRRVGEPPREPGGDDASVNRSPSPGARGVSLVETMIVIFIMGSLLTMAAPQIASVLDRARRAGSLSNLRQHAAAFTMYGGEHRDLAPRYTHPDADYSVIRGPGISVRVEGYWGGPALWNLALASYYDDDPFQEVFLPPGAAGGLAGNGDGFPVLFTPYYYSHSFIASPAFWSEETRLAGTAQWHSTRFADVVSPSQKGILIDTWSYLGPGTDFTALPASPVLVAFVDGSARSVARADLSLPYWRGVHQYGWLATMPVMHTAGGIQGRDAR